MSTSWIVGALVVIAIAGGAVLLIYVPAPSDVVLLPDAASPVPTPTPIPPPSPTTPTPTPSAASVKASGSPSPTPTPSPAPAPNPTPNPQTPPPPPPPPAPTPAPTPTPPVPKTVNVAIRGFAFSPASVTVNVGDTVVFTNHDAVGHTATANGGGFDTGILQEGQSKSVTLTQKGALGYFCMPHPGMTGTIVVQ